VLFELHTRTLAVGELDVRLCYLWMLKSNRE